MSCQHQLSPGLVPYHLPYLYVSYEEILDHLPGVEESGDGVLISPLKIFEPLGWKIVTLGDFLQVSLPG